MNYLMFCIGWFSFVVATVSMIALGVKGGYHGFEHSFEEASQMLFFSGLYGQWYLMSLRK